MRFYADLHVHSRFSRATSREGDLPHLAQWARRKGIAVVGTGDFTYPAWLDELDQKLVPAEPGLFRLKPSIEREVQELLSESGKPASATSFPMDATRFVRTILMTTIWSKTAAKDLPIAKRCAPDGRHRKRRHPLH